MSPEHNHRRVGIPIVIRSADAASKRYITALPNSLDNLLLKARSLFPVPPGNSPYITLDADDQTVLLEDALQFLHEREVLVFRWVPETPRRSTGNRVKWDTTVCTSDNSSTASPPSTQKGDAGLQSVLKSSSSKSAASSASSSSHSSSFSSSSASTSPSKRSPSKPFSSQAQQQLSQAQQHRAAHAKRVLEEQRRLQEEEEEAANQKAAEAAQVAEDDRQRRDAEEALAAAKRAREEEEAATLAAAEADRKLREAEAQQAARRQAELQPSERTEEERQQWSHTEAQEADGESTSHVSTPALVQRAGQASVLSPSDLEVSGSSPPPYSSPHSSRSSATQRPSTPEQDGDDSDHPSSSPLAPSPTRNVHAAVAKASMSPLGDRLVAGRAHLAQPDEGTLQTSTSEPSEAEVPMDFVEANEPDVAASSVTPEKPKLDSDSGMEQLYHTMRGVVVNLRNHPCNTAFRSPMPRDFHDFAEEGSEFGAVDFYIILERLDSRAYGTVLSTPRPFQQLEADLKRLWYLARSFYGPRSLQGQCADVLERFAEVVLSEWRGRSGSVPRKTVSQGTPVATSKAAKAEALKKAAAMMASWKMGSPGNRGEKRSINDENVLSARSHAGQRGLNGRSQKQRRLNFANDKSPNMDAFHRAIMGIQAPAEVKFAEPVDITLKEAEAEAASATVAEEHSLPITEGASQYSTATPTEAAVEEVEPQCEPVAEPEQQREEYIDIAAETPGNPELKAQGAEVAAEASVDELQAEPVMEIDTNPEQEAALEIATAPPAKAAPQRKKRAAAVRGPIRRSGRASKPKKTFDAQMSAPAASSAVSVPEVVEQSSKMAELPAQEPWLTTTAEEPTAVLPLPLEEQAPKSIVTASQPPLEPPAQGTTTRRRRFGGVMAAATVAASLFSSATAAFTSSR